MKVNLLYTLAWIGFHIQSTRHTCIPQYVLTSIPS